MEGKLTSIFLDNSNTIVKKLLDKYTVSFKEVLNSIEDIKLMCSSMPNTLCDILPQIATMGENIIKLPDEIHNFIAALEENLCANLESGVRDSHNNICAQLVDIFKRMKKIRKYLKNGSSRPVDHTSTHGTH